MKSTCSAVSADSRHRKIVSFSLTKRLVFWSVFFGVFGFIFSYTLSPFYVNGDQLFYRELYLGLRDSTDVSSAFDFYLNTVGAVEPAYLLLTAVFSAFFDKDFIYAVVNGTLMAVSSFLLLRRGAVVFIPLLLVVNFYYMTLFFSAERLKLAILVFELAFVFFGNWRWVLLILSCLFHFQMIIPVFSYLIWCTCKIKKTNYRVLIYLTLGLSFVGISWPYFSGNLLSYVSEKIIIYNDSGWGGFQALAKPLVFFSVAIFYTTKRFRLFVSILPILIAVYFIGSERMTILAFALMLFVAAGVKGGVNFPVLISCLYFAFGGIVFVMEFVKTGAVGA